jgi:hypothetical protein
VSQPFQLEGQNARNKSPKVYMLQALVSDYFTSCTNIEGMNQCMKRVQAPASVQWLRLAVCNGPNCVRSPTLVCI